jgi:serine/threonine protein kinase
MEEPLSVFSKLAFESGLVSREQLAQALADLRQSGIQTARMLDSSTDGMLVERLIETQALTRYQARQLQMGRTRFNLGPYIITDSIRQGDVSGTYKAAHTVTGRISSLEVLKPSAISAEASRSFRDMTRTIARLDHPNVLRLLDAGADAGVLYLVFEYAPGVDLRRLIRSQGPLPLREAASIIRQAALGLDHVHQQGLSHRDVRPTCILVSPAGDAKVCGAGFPALLEDAQPNPFAGKGPWAFDYMSPERIRFPHEITPLSDIYSLGCTLYYAVTGKVPFPGGSATSKARRHLEEAPYHPKRFIPDIPEQFTDLLADMMEKEASKRIPAMAEVAMRLEEWTQSTSAVDSSQTPSPPATSAATGAPNDATPSPDDT